MEKRSKGAYPEKPNTWALRLIELVSSNLFKNSPELNQAYRDCIKTIRIEQANQRHEVIKLVHTK